MKPDDSFPYLRVSIISIGVLLLLAGIVMIPAVAPLLIILAPLASVFICKIDSAKLTRSQKGEWVFGIMALTFASWFIIGIQEPKHWNFFAKKIFEGKMVTETVTKGGDEGPEWEEEVTYFKPNDANAGKVNSYFENGILILTIISLTTCYWLIPKEKKSYTNRF